MHTDRWTISVSKYKYICIHTCINKSMHTLVDGIFCFKLLDGQLLGIPPEEAKQLKIKCVFKKIKPTGQIGTLQHKEC